jgi:hypothetical protein
VDQQGRAVVKLSSPGGRLIFLGPAGLGNPKVRAPGVIAVDDDGGVGPAGICLNGVEQLSEGPVGHGESVLVGVALLNGNLSGVAIEDIRIVRQTDVNQDEVRLIVGDGELGAAQQIEIFRQATAMFRGTLYQERMGL